jgi:hypothetical protein
MDELWDNIIKNRGLEVPYLTRDEYYAVKQTYDTYLYNSGLGYNEGLDFTAAARAYDMLQSHEGIFTSR